MWCFKFYLWSCKILFDQQILLFSIESDDGNSDSDGNADDNDDGADDHNNNVRNGDGDGHVNVAVCCSLYAVRRSFVHHV